MLQQNMFLKCYRALWKQLYLCLWVYRRLVIIIHGIQVLFLLHYYHVFSSELLVYTNENLFYDKKKSNFRYLGITIFANLANCWRLLELTRIDMLIMSYGGLRGAIAFALALILDETKIPRKKEFVTATIAVVFFTVFVQVK